MKTIIKVIGGTSILLLSLFLLAQANEGERLPFPQGEESTITVTPEQKEKYPLKSTHAGLSLECVFCHVDQGKDPEHFEAAEEEACLSCHKSKVYLAERLSFMDTHKANPHNSVHDGPNLYCDECHKEHEPSINMCAECHEKEIQNNVWMKETP